VRGRDTPLDGAKERAIVGGKESESLWGGCEKFLKFLAPRKTAIPLAALPSLSPFSPRFLPDFSPFSPYFLSAFEYWFSIFKFRYILGRYFPIKFKSKN